MIMAKTEAQVKAGYLAQMSDEQLQCRAGGRHRWPSDEITAKSGTVPRGLSAEVHKGVYTITERCLRDCGRWRRFTTRSGGLFDLDTRYSYWSTEDIRWVTVPQDSGVSVTGRDCKGEIFQRALPLIRAAARERPE